MRYLLAAVALALCLAGPAAANLRPATSVFLECDGYGAPWDGGDGMITTVPIVSVGGRKGEAGAGLRVAVSMGVRGVAACDQALADARLLPKFQLRRANLMLARALHRLAAGAPEAALNDLDALDALRPNPADPSYDRSLGIGVSYARAYALRALGREAEADALIETAWRSRPFSFWNSAAALYAGGRYPPFSNTPYGQAAARLNPRLITAMMEEAMAAKDYGRAIELFGQIIPDTEPVDRVMLTGWEDGPLQIWEKQTTFWARHRALYAMALAKMGRVDEARAAIAAGRAEIDAALASPPRPATMFGVSTMAAAIAQTAPRMEKTAREPLDGAAQTVEKLAALPPEARAAFDLGLEPTSPPASAKALAMLMRQLPQPEEKPRAPLFDQMRPGTFGLLRNAVFYWEEGEATWLSCGMLITSEVTVEEMALLAAADRARELGKKGFIIIDRRDIHHSTLYLMHGFDDVERGDEDLETALAVVFVDPLALPPKYADAAWRVIDADAVHDALAPIYGKARFTRGRVKGRSNPALK